VNVGSNIPTSDVPLKERFYIYRGVVLHQRKGAAEDDQQYWAIKNAAPVITTLSPATMVKNNPFTLGVAGTSFDDQALIIFDGVAHVTIRNLPTGLGSKIDAADILRTGNYLVKVHNGNGQFSNELTFVVTAT
jgi:hypothetical protein